MRITADTNVLVRAVLRDEPRQSRLAVALLRDASLIAIPLLCLCELVWVLRGAKVPREEVSGAIRALVDAGNVVANRPAVEAGLAVHDAGGDFADGAMAHEGSWLGGDTFVSFDKESVKLLSAQGQAAQLLS